MQTYVTAKTTTGEIMAVGTCSDPVPVPDTDPPEFVDVFENVYVAPGCFKQKIDLPSPPDYATQYFDMTQEPPRIINRPDLDEGRSLAVPSPLHAVGTELIQFGPALPAGTIVRITCSHPGQPNIEGVIDDGLFQFDPQLPAVYEIELESFPYKTKKFLVEAL